MEIKIIFSSEIIDLSAGAVEYTDCISVEYTDCISASSHQRVSWYDTKQSDGEVPVMLELWVMQSTPSLPSLPGPLWSGVVAPDRVLSMGQIEVWHLNWVQTND